MPANRKALVDFFSRSLTSFQSSQDAFAVLHTLPHPGGSPPPAPPAPRAAPVRSLVVLDASFNPPTTAHAQMARSAVEAAAAKHGGAASVRLLLLLAVNNADKAPRPASFPVRLGMMEALGRELLSELGGGAGGLHVDLAVTTSAFFHDKARAIASSGVYGEEGQREGEAEQTFLAGFDTLVRIFDPKYYSGAGMRAALGPFFARARLRVTARPEGAWGGREEQGRRVEGLRDGGLEAVGGEGAWVRERVDLVEGAETVGEGVSSSRVREMVKKGEEVGEMVGEGVREWIEAEGLYGDGG